MEEGLYRKVEVASFGELELVVMMMMKIEKIYRDVEEHVFLGK